MGGPNKSEVGGGEEIGNLKKKIRGENAYQGPKIATLHTGIKMEYCVLLSKLSN